MRNEWDRSLFSQNEDKWSYLKTKEGAQHLKKLRAAHKKMSLEELMTDSVESAPLNLLSYSVYCLTKEELLTMSRKELARIMDRFFPYHENHCSMCKNRMIRHFECYFHLKEYHSPEKQRFLRKMYDIEDREEKER